MKLDKNTSKDSTEEHGMGRRRFLQTIGGAAATAIGATTLGLSSPVEAKGVSAPKSAKVLSEECAVRAARLVPHGKSQLDSLNLDSFAKRLNSKFTVGSGSSAVSMKLVEATDRNTRQVQGLETFSIVFYGPKDSHLQQGTYKFQGPLGTFDLFIVPIRDDPKGWYYEAVINRFAG
jgi:hypothetical protein